jgi:hypothetical protein
MQGERAHERQDARSEAEEKSSHRGRRGRKTEVAEKREGKTQDPPAIPFEANGESAGGARERGGWGGSRLTCGLFGGPAGKSDFTRVREPQEHRLKPMLRGR